MSLDIGFNFRSTLAYVTDPAGTVAVYDGAHVYPQTRGGSTFGVTNDNGGFALRDRSTGVDARFAGHGRSGDGAGPYKFQLDLPNAGNYVVHIAAGDTLYGQDAIAWKIYDDTTLLATSATLATSGANKYRDTTEVERSSDANWLANEVGVQYTFATTKLIYEWQGTTFAHYNPLTHLRIVEVPPATSTGTLAVTLDAVTLVATGTVTTPAVVTPAATQDTSGGSGRWEPRVDDDEVIVMFVKNFMEKL